ncbi:MAG TPA: hypothetical protein PLP50_03030 [Thermoanaerobaculia bacterium]|nr:hypothetical protein [Thermoanaerobaculia bacterium]HQN06468.1 hypothetical protein [Thermoanaerobaculia bacterium]HQP84625.1 hypothetical protein [Thermoanaerobaculia bacterium]
MRLLPLTLLAALSLARPADAGLLDVATGAVAPGDAIAVAWTLPPGFEESELLIQVDGGPRIRLTPECHDENPRFVIEVPALAGRARFVLRAGRVEEDGVHREHTIDSTEWFQIAPSFAAGPLPIRAPHTHPSEGEEMEWWSDSVGRVPEGPTSGLHRPWTAEVSAATPSSPALSESRSEDLLSSESSVRGDVDARARNRNGLERGYRERSFPGAPVPLRN